MVVESHDMQEQQDRLLGKMGAPPNGEEPTSPMTIALGELWRAPWRRRGEKPRLEPMSARPWRKQIDPLSDSSVSTAFTSQSAPSSPLAGNTLMVATLSSTWPSTSASLAQSESEQTERYGILSAKCPGGCIDPSAPRKAAPFTRMHRAPHSARALVLSAYPTSPPYVLPPLSAREPGKDVSLSDLLSAESVSSPEKAWSSQVAPPQIGSPQDDGESGFVPSDIGEGDVNMLSDSEAPTSPSFPLSPRLPPDPAFMAMLDETISELQRVSGVWDPELWLKAWKAILKNKSVEGVEMLFKSVRITTEWALQKQAYRSQTFVRHANGLVDLSSIFPNVRKVHWFGRANVDIPEFMNDNEAPQKKTPPPIIFTELKALEVATQLRKIYGKKKQIFIVTELTGFDYAGDVKISRHKGMHPYCLPLRSDFSRFVADASMQMKGSTATMQQHLCASADPYVFHCSGVTVFRGGRVDGFPFLEDPFKFDVIATAMPPGRPPVQKVQTQEGQTMWYAYRNDHQSLLERYSLLGLVGMHAMRVSPEGPEDLPILIITALGSEVKHPCDAIISILKNWRRRFAPYFASVYICWGRPTCSDAIDYADDAVNRSIYRINVLEGISADLAAAKVLPWHWDSRELKMSCARGKLEKVAMQCRKLAKKNSVAVGKTGRSTPPPALIQILAPTFAPSQAPPQFDMSGDQRRETSQNALAALRSLNELAVPNSGTDGRTTPHTQSPGEETDSDKDDEPPPSLTHMGMAPGLEQTHEQFVRASHARLSVLPPPPGSTRVSVVSIGAGIAGLAPSSPKAQRQAALESSKELIGHKNSSATMTGIVLAGGIRNLLGFEKQSISSRCGSPESQSPASSPRTMRSSQMMPESPQESPMRRSMMRSYSKLLKEDGVTVERKNPSRKNTHQHPLDVDDAIKEYPSQEESSEGQREIVLATLRSSEASAGENDLQPLPKGEENNEENKPMRRHSSTGQFSHVRRLSLQAMGSMGQSSTPGRRMSAGFANSGRRASFSTAALKEQLSDHLHARVDKPDHEAALESTDPSEGHHIPMMTEAEKRRKSIEEVMGKGAVVVDRGRSTKVNQNSAHLGQRRHSAIGAKMEEQRKHNQEEARADLRSKFREELLKPRRASAEEPQRRSSLSHVGDKVELGSARRSSFSVGEGRPAAVGGRRLSSSMVSAAMRGSSSGDVLTAEELSAELKQLTKRSRASLVGGRLSDTEVPEDELASPDVGVDQGEKRSSEKSFCEKSSLKKSVQINSSKISIEDKLTVKQEADKLRLQLQMAEKDSSTSGQHGKSEIEHEEDMTPSLRSRASKLKTSNDFISNATAKSEDELVSETQVVLDRFRQHANGEGTVGSRPTLEKKCSKSSLRMMQAQGFDDEDAPPEGGYKAGDHRRISSAQHQGIIGARNLFF